MALFGLGKKEETKKQPAAKAVVSARPVKNSEAKIKTEALVINRPLVTEKAIGLESNSQYVFKVTSRATKPEVKKES